MPQDQQEPVENSQPNQVYASESQSVSSPLPESPTPPNNQGLFSKINLKVLLIAVGAIAVLGVGVIIASKLMAPKAPVGATLTYWGLWEEQGVIDGIIKEYEATNPAIKINYVRESKEDYRERLVNSLAKGNGPDIFRFHNTWGPMLADQLAPLPSEVMDATTYQQTFYPVAARDLSRGTDLVGVPLMVDGLGLFINEELFATTGKTPPTTWEELREVARALTVRDAEGRIQQAGIALGRTDNVDHWEDILSLMMLQNRADLSNPVGELAEGALAYFTAFTTRDKVWDKTLPPSTQAFSGGKLAMYFGPSWRAFEIKQLNPNLKFKVIPVPQLPKNVPNEPDITWATYWVEGVSAKSKSPTEAWKFLKFLTSRESLEKLYSSAAKTRLFGPAYPRPDMAGLLENDPLVGAFVREAPVSVSWYLASRTFDGQTGINSRIAAYFRDAVNSVVDEQKEPADVLPTVAAGVKQVLSSYNR